MEYFDENYGELSISASTDTLSAFSNFQDNDTEVRFGKESYPVTKQQDGDMEAIKIGKQDNRYGVDRHKIVNK